MITHVVYYKPRGVSGCYIKLMHSLEYGEKWIEHHKKHQDYWSFHETSGFDAVTGEVYLKFIKDSESEE